MATQGGTTVTFTDEQLWTAVRSVGSDGQSFTCATVREFLGVATKQRHELAQFRDRFRAFRLAAGGEIVKAGKSAYRLKPTAAEAASEVAPAVEAAPEAAPAVIEAAPAPASSFESPAAVDDADLGFGEPMDVVAADSGELAANHVIFSAWPESMLPAAETAEAPVAAASDDDAVTTEVLIPQPTEAEIEAEVREIVAAPEVPAQPESLFSQAEQAVIRTWQNSGQWLGRRFAELFSRSQ
jgi:hypothetical protein